MVGDGAILDNVVTVHRDHVSVNINNSVIQTHNNLKSGRFGDTIIFLQVTWCIRTLF